MNLRVIKVLLTKDYFQHVIIVGLDYVIHYMNFINLLKESTIKELIFDIKNSHC